MSKLKVGDLVIASSTHYGFTSIARLCICEVVKVVNKILPTEDDLMRVRVISCLMSNEELCDDNVGVINSEFEVSYGHFIKFNKKYLNSIKSYCENLLGLEAYLASKIEEGDKVEVVDSNKQYLRYTKLFRHCKNKELAAYFNYGESLKLKETYYVEEIVHDPGSGGNIAILFDKDRYNTYMIDVNGLRKCVGD